MKKILVPCDFSPTSKEAFKMAIDIASKSGGTVSVLHVISIPVIYAPDYVGDYTEYSSAYFSEMEKQAMKSFDLLKNESGNSKAAISFETATGDITSSILTSIEERQIDLVVMGTNGTSGLTGVFIGSNAEKVVRKSPVPVLAVRKAKNLNVIKNILLATSCGLNETAFISKVKDLQSFFNAKLVVLLVNTPLHFHSTPEGLEILRAFAAHYKLENYELHFFNNYYEEDGIIDFATSHKADCVVMATHGRRGFAHLFNGSVTENVVNHIDVPVWTFPLKRKD